MIVERQKGNSWGKSIVERLAEDLRKEFPGVEGFSSQNLWYMRQFYSAYASKPKLQPLVGEISCRSKNRVVVEYALREATKPIGVATYKVVKQLPRNLRSELPSPDQIGERLENV